MNKKSILCYLINILNFYALPLLISDTGSAMFVMLIIMPVICFATAIVYGKNTRFRLGYSFVVAILFIPSVYIYYNSSAWLYTFIFLVIALFGNLVAVLLSSKK